MREKRGVWVTVNTIVREDVRDLLQKIADRYAREGKIPNRTISSLLRYAIMKVIREAGYHEG